MKLYWRKKICKFTARLTVGTKPSYRRSSLITTKAFEECKEMIANATVNLGKRLQEVDEKLEALHPRDLALSDEITLVKQQIQQERDATLRCLGICAQVSTQVDENRSNVFSDVAMAEGGHHVAVTTNEDLISASRITAGAKSMTLIGQISDVDHAHLVSSHARDDSSDSGLSEQSSVSSVKSLVDGVFSIASGSSNSSVVGPAGAGEKLVALLLSDTHLSSLYQETLERVSANKFERNFLRILNFFASELRKEAENPEQKSIAKFVRYRARNSAHIVRNSLYSLDKPQEDITPKFEGYHEPIDESDESDIGSVSDHELDTDLQQLEDFFLTSYAFIKLRYRLAAFIYPTNEEEVDDKGKQLPAGRFASN